MEAQTEIQVGQLDVVARQGTGKGINRKLRAQGKIPAVIYGEGKGTNMITLDPLGLDKALDPKKRRNTVLTLKVAADDGSVAVETVMVKEFQTDTLKDQLTHVDFIRVSDANAVKARVPLRLEGRAVGVTLGGKVRQVYRDLEVECAPSLIPAEIVGNVSELNVGGTLPIKNLVLPEGVRVTLEAERTVALVSMPKGAGAAAEEEAADAAKK